MSAVPAMTPMGKALSAEGRESNSPGCFFSSKSDTNRVAVSHSAIMFSHFSSFLMRPAGLSPAKFEESCPSRLRTLGLDGPDLVVHGGDPLADSDPAT